jgi:GNAT superfamily N-acetyltransferase
MVRMEQIRNAAAADVAAMADLAGTRRQQYAQYQPLFWRPAAGALDVHRPYLAKLVGSDTVITLVSEDAGELTGFLVATLTGAPGVYDPGGPTCQIDDFAVVPGDRWQTTGARLLRAGLAEAGRRGALQAVVITGHLDEPKREMLRACGLEIASEWWVTPQPLPGPDPMPGLAHRAPDPGWSRRHRRLPGCGPAVSRLRPACPRAGTRIRRRRGTSSGGTAGPGPRRPGRRGRRSARESMAGWSCRGSLSVPLTSRSGSGAWPGTGR